MRQNSKSDALRVLENFKRYVTTVRQKSNVRDAFQRRGSTMKKEASVRQEGSESDAMR